MIRTFLEFYKEYKSFKTAFIATFNQIEFGNDWERIIFDKKTPVRKVEEARYKWASSFSINTGKKKYVLDVGTGCGYGSRYFENKQVIYIGVDKDKEIIDFAKRNYWCTNNFFICKDIFSYLANTAPDTFDVLMAFEFIEHIKDGVRVAQDLKQYAKKLLITVPYLEPCGFWGTHHKLWELDEKRFPGYKVRYLLMDGTIAEVAPYTVHPKTKDKACLMLLESI